MSPIGIVHLYALCCYVRWHKCIFALFARRNRRALCFVSLFIRFSIQFSCSFISLHRCSFIGYEPK